MSRPLSLILTALSVLLCLWATAVLLLTRQTALLAALMSVTALASAWLAFRARAARRRGLALTGLLGTLFSLGMIFLCLADLLSSTYEI